MIKSKTRAERISPVLIVAAFIIIIAGVKYASSIVTLMLMALFVSIICAQPISWLEKRKVPHGLAIVIVLLGILLIFFGLGELIGESLAGFTKDAPEYENRLNEIGTTLFQSLNDKGFNISHDQLIKMLAPGKIINFTATVISELGEIMGSTILILFVVLFILLEFNSFSVKTKAIVKIPAESLNYLEKIGKSIRYYLGIKTMACLLTGVFIWVCLIIIGVDYAILWALIVFLLNYIPTIGPIIAGVPAALFALIQLGFGGAMWTIGSYVVVNMLIGNVIEPKMMGKGMGLSTLVVFIALIFWGFVLGTVGMFLSVPLTMSIKIMLEQSEKTRWIAILLGTQEDAQTIVDERQSAVRSQHSAVGSPQSEQGAK
ncbi:MAG: AI-2E family transporter [Bacteroidetes bacterium]|nr:AI-2E family transporter [Bacteroidota bacterium]MBL7104209.1 AI-2E family transporter [Bacteroidales bacterium]